MKEKNTAAADPEDLPDDIGLGRLDETDWLTLLAEREYR